MADIRQRGGAAASTEIDVVYDEDEALLRRNMSVDQLNKLVSSVSSKPSADQEDSSAIKKMRTAEDVRNEFQLLEQPVHRTKLPASEKTEAELDAESWSTRVKGLLPILEWAPKYGRDCKYHAGSGEPFRENVRRDVLAGMVIGVMLVPQGMAYALLAGLPPIYGLYSSTWTLVAYMVTGTCRLLGPGVNAPISLLVADALSSALMLDEGCEDNPDGADCKYFIEQSLLLCLLIGVLYLVMASAVCAVFLHARTRLMAPCMLFRVGAAGEKRVLCAVSPPTHLQAAANLGIVTAFMPEPALSGFTTGAAAIIITSNIKLFFGMSVPRGGVVHTWVYIISHAGELSGWTLLMGCFAYEGGLAVGRHFWTVTHCRCVEGTQSPIILTS